jgi:hypothetical protein
MLSNIVCGNFEGNVLRREWYEEEWFGFSLFTLL